MCEARLDPRPFQTLKRKPLAPQVVLPLQLEFRLRSWNKNLEPSRRGPRRNLMLGRLLSCFNTEVVIFK